MSNRIILIFLCLTFYSEATQLSKAEIKSIILNASKYKKYSARVPKKMVGKNKKEVARKSQKNPPKIVKKKVTKKILPFVLPSDYEKERFAVGQRGFVLIKGISKSRTNKKRNPLYSVD